MVKVDLFAVAEAAIQDLPTRRLSLINLLEDFTGAGFPLFVPKFTAVANVSWDGEGASETSISLKVSNNDQELLALPFKVSFPGEARKNRVVWNFQGMPLQAPGVLKFEVQNEGNVIATHVLNVVALKAPPEAKVIVQSAPQEAVPQEASPAPAM
ncbi:hypothetical protein CfE428DRAFT_4007 [Chthoniobacter flavus Ellin428]|uniref:Uncharacterized protein n=1 Tax=Chthoniobacter flavus Ellin428 TaxID=497964 RepID=B4D518_9BACT|nr:hypothetical protein [Chthoniobacter flavus]EDY18621.1 hypothetical protein CfE428DRAFT_4007 [Chthoniobacter flavus Ellin428]TCO90923.1 hypothetical protein EV701_10972 [Chthoniobacter flavus]